MAQFTVEKAPELKAYRMEKFLGMDTRSNDMDISPSRSPMCPNMIRDYVGNVRKRYGYKTMDAFPGRINGVHFLVKDKKARLIHSGSKYYALNPTEGEELKYKEVFEGGDYFSTGNQANGKLYILDGTKYAQFDGEKMEMPEGKIPVIIINRPPTGGGTPLEQINLIQPKRIEKFKGNGAAKDFQLTATSLDVELVTVKKLESSGTFTDLIEDTDFTVNRELGKVSFNTAPPSTPSAGEDNVFITYAKTVEGYVDRINHCRISVVYGMNGAADRLIVSGNSKFPHYDWYSKSNDFTFFGDLDYNTVGQDNSAIMGYAIDGGNLITIKDEAENQVNSVIRKFDLVDSKAVLKSIGSIQTRGAASRYSFSYLEIEPMYIAQGNRVNAITVADNRLERFSQSRSYYIDPLIQDLDLSESYAVNYNDFYIFNAPDGNLYLVDGLQPTYEKNTPYSNRQYECFMFTGVNARILWTEDKHLWFGTADGKVKMFGNKPEQGSLSDDGQPYNAHWTTPVIFAEWNYLKTFKYLYMLLQAFPRTSVKVEARIEGKWEEIIPYNADWRYFTFEDLDFENFTFNTSASEKTSGTKINIKKVQSIQLRFTNDRAEPMSISKLALTYIVLRPIK